MKKNTFLTILLSLFLVGGMFAQETVWVSATGAGATNGTSEADAYGDFAVALGTIVAGDILRVSSGSGPVTVNASTANWAAKNFAYTIQGDLVGSTLVKSGGAGARIITLNDAAAVGLNVTFKNITFSGSTGVTLLGGGAVLYSNQAVTLNFENCRFEGNSLATTTVLNGGGALNITNSTVTLTDCLFKENTALRNGGAISMLAGNLTMTRCTFYKNKITTAGTTTTVLPDPVGGGAALYVTGVSTVNVSNCTFFQNTTGNTNQDYGTIRSDNGNTTVTNSLFYDNKTNNDAGGTSDWGAGTAGTQTFSYSIGQWITSNIDTRTNFISFVKGGLDPLAAANLSSSNLFYNDTLGKVTYGVAAVGDATPIGFGSDGKDVGAWEYVVAVAAITSLTSDGTTAITEGCGGSTLVIKGTELTGATAVTVNGVDVASFVVTNATTITAILPAGPIAAGAVVVTTPSGIATSAGSFAVNAIPNTPTISAGPTSFCAGGSVTLTSDAASGNQWYKDGVLIGGATATTYSATASGTYTVIATANGCPSAASAGTAVTEQALPNAGTDGTLTVCVGTIPNNTELFAALTGADTGGSWSNVDLVY
ncbi:MAG: putative outer membrane repeat protein, partial [Mariniflexile sp.]